MTSDRDEDVVGGGLEGELGADVGGEGGESVDGFLLGGGATMVVERGLREEVRAGKRAERVAAKGPALRGGMRKAMVELGVEDDGGWADRDG